MLVVLGGEEEAGVEETEDLEAEGVVLDEEDAISDEEDAVLDEEDAVVEEVMVTTIMSTVMITMMITIMSTEGVAEVGAEEEVEGVEEEEVAFNMVVTGNNKK